MSRELARLTEKQLARLEPLLGEQVVTAVALASISHRNQGRQRQESLVARMLRESASEAAEAAQLRVRGWRRGGGRGERSAFPCHCSEAGNAASLAAAVRLPSRPPILPWRPSPALSLQAAIDSVRTGQGAIANPAVSRQLEAWMAALLAGEAEAATQVFGLATAAGGDLQQLRQLVRQAQQTEAAAPAAADASDSSDDAAEAAAVPAAPAGVRLTSKARAARKQLRKLLQPLAEAQQEAESEEAE
jgi:ribosomal 50S subunit-associated protein YjgA (DUF615 family)